MEITSDLEYHIIEGANPLVFVPDVDFSTLTDPSIVDVF